MQVEILTRPDREGIVGRKVVDTSLSESEIIETASKYGHVTQETGREPVFCVQNVSRFEAVKLADELELPSVLTQARRMS